MTTDHDSPRRYRQRTYDGVVVPSPEAPPVPRVVVAPDSFKGSLDATYVAQHLALGLHRAWPGLEVTHVPVADGGEGTVAAALRSGMEAVKVQVAGPFGEPVRARYATDRRTAVIELAQVAGLHLSPGDGEAALRASTIGVGELVRHALDAGAISIVL